MHCCYLFIIQLGQVEFFLDSLSCPLLAYYPTTEAQPTEIRRPVFPCWLDLVQGSDHDYCDRRRKCQIRMEKVFYSDETTVNGWNTTSNGFNVKYNDLM